MDDPFVPRAENRLEKYNSARAIFYPSFFPSTLPIVNSWLGTFFQKELSLQHFHKFLSTFFWAWLNRKNTKNDWNTTPFYFKKPSLVNSILKAWNVRLMHYCYKPFVATCITTNNYFVGGIECLMHFMATKEGGS